MKINRTIFLFILLLSLTILTSCCYAIEPKDSALKSSGNTSTISLSEKRSEDSSDDINIVDLKSTITSSINDLNWYTGNNSEFSLFEGKKVAIDIYKDETDSVWVIFYSTDNKNYMAALFSKMTVGYANEPFSYHFDDKSNIKTEKSSLISEGYNFYRSDEIIFRKVTKPKYPEVDTHKQKVLTEIEKIIPDAIGGFGVESGEYKYYIRNFRVNDIHTNVVIENEKKCGTWILDINLNEDSTITKGKLYECNNQNTKYEANQYKKVSIFKKELSIN